MTEEIEAAGPAGRPEIDVAERAAEPGPAAVARLDVGSLIGRTLDTYGASLPLFLGLALPTALLSALLTAFAFDIATIAILALASALAGAFTGAATTLAAEDVRIDRRTELGVLARLSLGRLLPVLAAYVVFGLAVAGLIVAAGLVAGVFAVLGAIPVAVLLVVVAAIPIVILSIRWSLVLPAVALDGHGPVGGLRRSWAATRGNVWRLAGVLFVVGLLVIPASLGVSLVGTYAPQSWPGIAASFVGAAITTPLFAIPLALAYADLTRPDAAAAVVRPRAGRPVVLALVLGLGILIAVGGVAAAVASGGQPFDADRGRVLTGTSSNPLDPCHPGDVATRFSTTDEIWVAGVFSRHVAAGETVTVHYAIDGEDAGSQPLAAGPDGLDCYYEGEPLQGIPAGSYRIEVRDGSGLLAEGEFVVEE